MKKQLPAWAALCIISLAAGLLLALTNWLTADRIAEQAAQAADAARYNVLGAAEAFAEQARPEDSALDSVHEATAAGEVVGYVGQITVKGYGGPIEVVAGMNLNGDITGVVVGGSKFAETAGLGAKTKDAAFTGQFANKRAPLALKQDVDGVAGATISSGAVVSGVNKIAAYVETLLPGYVPEVEEASGAVETRVVTVQGFAGEIEVSVGLAADGTIAHVDIGGANFAETSGFGERALEKDFRDQFIGHAGELGYGNGIDALAGATVTSNAVMSAVNEALAQGPVVGPTMITETVQGFAGEIEVTVGINADGTIASLDVGGANFAETSGFGERATEKGFRDQFIGHAGELAYGNGIDALAGATITSNAVMSAVNQALAQFEPSEAASAQPASEPAPTPEPTAEPTAEPTVEPTAEPTEAPASAPSADADAKTVTVQGFAGPVEVTVALNADGTIASVEVGGEGFSETPGFGARAQEAAFTDQFIGKSGALAYGDGIDAIAGATVTSEAVLGAINEIIGDASEPDDAPESSKPDDAPESSEPDDAPEAAAPESDNAKTVTVQGFAGPVEVTVALNADGTIASVAVGGEGFSETPGFGARAQEAAFTDQFIGKSGALAYGDGIDAIAGATVTSEAVLGAINEILAE